MRTLFTTIVILCAGCSGSLADHDNESNTLKDAKQKSLILLQRKAMNDLYPEEVLNDWENDAKNCENVAEADSLYNVLLDRAVNAEQGSYGVNPDYADNDDEPIIRTTRN